MSPKTIATTTPTDPHAKTHIDMGDILQDRSYVVGQAAGCQKGSLQEERQKNTGPQEDNQNDITMKPKQSDKRSR